MRTHGFNPSEEDLRDMIRNVDKNANGAIDFNEFIEMMLKQGGRGSTSEIVLFSWLTGVNADEDAAHAFKVFDRDGDGLITAEELRYTQFNTVQHFFSCLNIFAIKVLLFIIGCNFQFCTFSPLHHSLKVSILRGKLIN